MKKVAIVAISLEKVSNLYGLEALKASGNNFGNMLFTNAAYEQITNAEHIGFSWQNIELIRDKYSSLFIPASNWISANSDWGDLAELIEKTDLPCTIVGLGSQLNGLEDVDKVSSGTRRLLKVVSERCESLGVRGEFTADVVRACGISNVEVVGCPSIFTFGEVPKLRDVVPNRIERIGVGPTRFVFEKAKDGETLDKQRQLYQFAIREASSIYYQSEQYEIGVLARGEDNADQAKVALEYYGISSKAELEKILLEKGKYHTSLSNWIDDVKKDDLYIGTRIHGAIAATLAGTPPILITHDNRTRELAEYMGVPSMPLKDFDIGMLFDIPELLGKVDYSKYALRSEANLKQLKDFYRRNSVTNNLEIDSAVESTSPRY
jgi:hypothetical protein